MLSTVVLALLALTAPLPSVGADTLPDAYLDPGARTLVERARERRSSVEGRIQSYSTLSRSRTTVGVRALRRDRTLYRCDEVSRIDWHAGDTIRVQVLGAREALPMFSGDLRAGDGDCGEGTFDPSADRLGFALGGGMSQSDSTFLRHPLADDSELNYRFRSGGTTTLRLADGTTIRLLELQVLPRRSEPFLLSGSLWLEDRSYAVVRAVLRMARPFDYERDHTPDEDDEDDVPRILRPLRADLRYVTIEYGLWDQQWWLPRLVALEGEAEAGRLLSVPLRVERTYDAYEVVALAPDAPLPEPPEMDRENVCGGNDDDSEDDDDVDADESTQEEAEAEDRSGPRREVGCECAGGRCRVVVTTLADSASLVASTLLPRSAFEEGNVLVSDREMADLLGRVQGIANAPWGVTSATWRVGLQGFDLVRYNRVEALSVGAAANVGLGPAAVDATVRLGIADLVPNFDLRLSRESAFSRLHLAGYRRLEAVGPMPASLGLGASMSALLFGRDDGEYYRTLGLEAAREPAGGGSGLSWRLFAEMQRGAERNTNVSLAHTLGGEGFRENIAADDAEQVGVQMRLRGTRGANPVGWRGGGGIAVLASAGTFQFVQPTATLMGAAPLPLDLLGSVELNGGASFGETPSQSLHYLGGGRTVRGYAGNSARGEAFWTARGEVATAAPGARIVLFADAGWAGEPDAVSAEPLLLSAGAGVSFMDGLVRLDLARALKDAGSGRDWRLELQLDAGL